MDKSRIRILVVDDERGLCLGVQEALHREGYSVDASTDPADALGRLTSVLYNLVVADMLMPGISGLELLRKARETQRDTQFIIMTAHGTIENAVDAMKAGAYDYISKPLDLQRLRALVLKALEFQALVAENSELRQRLQKRSEPSLLLGHSPGIRHVIRQIDEVAPTDVTVLIEGESGTGKELVARSIHLKSLRVAKSFISVNCAALPEPLLESELFGHAKGAFTGALHNKPGRFQLADGGSLFLDEIGDLSAKGQGDLLRVLEDGTFRSVGGVHVNHVDVRVIAATNKNLHDAVAAGRFREDLFYRLQVVPITVPALRYRSEDIPMLMTAFLEHFRAKHRRGPKRFSREAQQVMQRFPWPGNVRQLRNAIERIVLTCHDPIVAEQDLPDFILENERSSPTFPVRPGMSLAEVEKLLIRQTLFHVTANREEAARALGISRRALQYKLKQYGLLDSEPNVGAAAVSTEPRSTEPPDSSE